MSQNPATVQDQRDQLFDRAKYGEITGDYADAEAIRLGLGSLSHKPGPDEFRPEAVTHWTLPMAVAWIAYRDLEEVREWSAPYRAECLHWIWQRWRVGLDGPIQEGWHLDRRSKPTLSLLRIGAAIDCVEEKPPAMTIGEAQEALWIALQEGFFAASGIDTETDRRVEIPPLDWHELVVVEGKGEVDEVRRGLLGSGYRDPLVPSVAIRGLWREPVEKAMRLPALVRPDGDGYMPLYCAAQWIASESGQVNFSPEDPPRWRAAYTALLAAITSEKIRVVGLRSGEREIIPSHIFAGIQVDYPFEDPELELMVGPELYLRSYAYRDDEHWRGGFDDALIQKREDKWTRLMVDKPSVRRLWPGRPSKSSLATGALPLSMSPSGHGYMPLYCAAEWIATEGGTVDFEVNDEARWVPAFDALLSAIASEKVRVTGIGNQLREAVPAPVFADLRVFYPSGNADDSFLGTGSPFLQSWPYSQEEWRSGFTDKIVSNFEDEWTALMVEKGDVRSLWPSGSEPDKADGRTGLPGRPGKAKHLIEDEFRRRILAGILAPSLSAESHALLNWLIEAHPAAQRPTVRVIANNIRAGYREHSSRTK